MKWENEKQNGESYGRKESKMDKDSKTDPLGR
jgi:hypothetical protein